MYANISNVSKHHDHINISCCIVNLSVNFLLAQYLLSYQGIQKILKNIRYNTYVSGFRENRRDVEAILPESSYEKKESVLHA